MTSEGVGMAGNTDDGGGVSGAQIPACAGMTGEGVGMTGNTDGSGGDGARFPLAPE